MKDTIQHSLFYAHAPEAVWEFLTDSEQMTKWLMKNDFRPEVGHRFQFMAGPAPSIDFNGTVDCTVLEVVPNRKLAYTWRPATLSGAEPINSTVTWTLTPHEGGTMLELLHTDCERDRMPAMFDAMTEGWKNHMQKIGQLLPAAYDERTA